MDKKPETSRMLLGRAALLLALIVATGCPGRPGPPTPEIAKEAPWPAGARPGCRPDVASRAAGVTGSSAAGAPAPAEATQPAAAGVLVDLEPGPITLFEEACARCHGPHGSFYGEDFANLEEPELRHMVEDMMKGPGGLDPTEADVQAMIAYHKALHAAEPFLIVTNAQSFATGNEKSLKGEVSPGATVQIRRDGRTVPANVDETTWTAQDLPARPFDVVAERESKQVVVRFPLRQWSQAAGKP